MLHKANLFFGLVLPNEVEPKIGELIVALLRHGHQSSLRAAYSMARQCGAALAHSFMMWGEDLGGNDAALQRAPNQQHDRSVWWSCLQKYFSGESPSLEAAVEEAGLGRVTASRIHQAQL